MAPDVNRDVLRDLYGEDAAKVHLAITALARVRPEVLRQAVEHVTGTGRHRELMLAAALEDVQRASAELERGADHGGRRGGA